MQHQRTSYVVLQRRGPIKVVGQGHVLDLDSFQRCLEQVAQCTLVRMVEKLAGKLQNLRGVRAKIFAVCLEALRQSHLQTCTYIKLKFLLNDPITDEQNI